MWRELGHSPGLGLIFVGAGSLHAVAHGALAWCAAMLGKTLVGGGTLTSAFGALAPATIGFLGLAAAIVKGGAGTLATFAQSRLSGSLAHGLRQTVTGSLLRHGLRASAPTAVAKLVSRVREAERSAHEGVLASVRAAAQLIPIAVALCLVSVHLTLVAAVVLIPFAVFLAWVRNQWRAKHRESMGATDLLNEQIDDLVRHADLWRTHGTGERVERVIQDLGQQACRLQARSETLRAALSSMNEVLAALGLVLAIAAAMRLMQSPSANLVAFCAIFFMAYRPVRDLGDARTAVLRGDEALASLVSIARQEQPIVVFPRIEALACDSMLRESRSMASLSVQAVAVPGRMRPVTFTLPPGQLLVIAGPTGAGKTTALRALVGLEPDAVGHVRFDGVELPHGAVGPALRPFAWVPQDAPVIFGTLADNLRLAGADEATALTELVTLGAFDLPDRIAAAKLGAGGRGLSGGERRWIALARALATQQPVLLLDEPTVGLDSESKKRVLQTLGRLRGHRSMVVVSHDGDVIGLADQVVVMSRPDGPRACAEAVAH